MNTKLREALYLELQGAQIAIEAGKVSECKKQLEKAIALLDGYGYGYSDESDGGQKKSWLDTLTRTFRGRG